MPVPSRSIRRSTCNPAGFPVDHRAASRRHALRRSGVARLGWSGNLGPAREAGGARRGGRLGPLSHRGTPRPPKVRATIGAYLPRHPERRHFPVSIGFCVLQGGLFPDAAAWAVSAEPRSAPGWRITRARGGCGLPIAPRVRGTPFRARAQVARKHPPGRSRAEPRRAKTCWWHRQEPAAVICLAKSARRPANMRKSAMSRYSTSRGAMVLLLSWWFLAGLNQVGPFSSSAACVKVMLAWEQTQFCNPSAGVQYPQVCFSNTGLVVPVPALVCP